MSETQVRNNLHEQALAVVENAVANGVKIKYCDTVERDPWTCTINPKTVREVSDKILAMNAKDRFKYVIKKHLQLVRSEVVMHTKITQNEISRISGELVKEGYIKKIVLNNSASHGKKVIYSYVDGK